MCWINGPASWDRPVWETESCCFSSSSKWWSVFSHVSSGRWCMSTFHHRGVKGQGQAGGSSLLTHQGAQKSAFQSAEHLKQSHNTKTLLFPILTEQELLRAAWNYKSPSGSLFLAHFTSSISRPLQAHPLCPQTFEQSKTCLRETCKTLHVWMDLTHAGRFNRICLTQINPYYHLNECDSHKVTQRACSSTL